MKKVTAKAPINIALIKYWGKEDELKVIPYNSSLSLTLDNLYTVTTIEESTSGFSFTLNNKVVDGKELKRVYEFLKLFASIEELEKIKVSSTNYVPTGAGLASSASAFAALSIAANKYFNTNYVFDKLSSITRLGSGSACRSLLGGFVAWEKSGMVYQVNSKVNDFVMISVIVDSNKKEISSRNAMAISIKTSPLYKMFVDEANDDFSKLKLALELGNLKEIGKLTKNSALMMHAVMASTNPPIEYLKEKSYEIIDLCDELLELGLYCYPTMDAGANVKILTNEKDFKKIIQMLEKKGFIDYYISRPGEGALIIDEQDS